MAFEKVTIEKLLEIEQRKNKELASKLQETENALLELAQIIGEDYGTVISEKDTE